ncbi:MAG: hypothetical protein QXU20_00075 [Candidatus Woesearchaeota archaeon]
MICDFKDEDVKKIITDFNIKTNVKKIFDSAAFKVFEYYEKPYKTFLLDCTACMKIACFPSIVGEELDKLSMECANHALKFFKENNILNSNFLFYHVLRASLGYNMHNVFDKKDFREVFIRTKYVINSYRAHDENSRQVEIVFEDFNNLKFFKNSECDLFLQDTVASGKTSFKALQRLFELSYEYKINFNKIIYYGFLSEKGMDFLWNNLIRKNCNELIVLSFGNLTALCNNGYDMPLYGPDESYYSKTNKLLNLGCVASEETIKDWAKYFIPGTDQPGDWSERQNRVFCGDNYEEIDLNKHINNSLNYILKIKNVLMENYPWLYDRTKSRIEEEINNLKSKL